MFKCINNKGFQMEFQNGWTVSVMFGRGNYCENNHKQIPWPHQANTTSAIDSPDAEVWAWKGDSNQPRDPMGWKSPAEVAEFINEVANRCHCGHRDKPYSSDHCHFCGCEEHEATCDLIMPEGFDRVPE